MKNNLTEDQVICNKAWTMFNRNLNTGLEWNDAKTETMLDAEKLKVEYDQSFDEKHGDVEGSEFIWERSMDQFNSLISKIEAI